MWHSFTTGLLAPTLIIGLDGAAPSDREAAVDALPLFTPFYTAQLQPDPGPAAALPREVVIHAAVPLKDPRVLVFWADGTVEQLRRNPSGSEGVWLLDHRVGQSPVGLALNAAAHVVTSDVPVKTPQIPIPDGDGPVHLRLNLQQTFLGGLLDGLGLDRYASGMIDASLEPMEEISGSLLQ